MSDPHRNEEAPPSPPAASLWGNPWAAPALEEERRQAPGAQPVSAQPVSAQPVSAQPAVVQAVDVTQPMPGSVAGQPDASQPDASQPDAGPPDAGQPDQSFPYPPPPGSTTLTWPAPPQTPAALDEPRKRRGGALLAAAVTLSLIAGVAGGVLGAWLLDRPGAQSLRSPGYSLPEPSGGSTARPADSVAGVASAVLPSVVAILVSGNDGEGTGSGFVIDGPKGYILTNNHVVASADPAGALTVVLDSGEQETAKIVGRDPSYDLAVIKVDRTDLPALEFGDSDAVVVGDPVVAVGAPLGLQGTVTTGIVSALNRPVAAGDENETSYINAVQTDAAINPGNSGGPLVNADGRVIGVNSAIARSPGSMDGASGSIGLGFAIPSKQARKTAEQLIKSGRAVHPIIGVVLDRGYEGEGVKVMEDGQSEADPVTDGGPADKAGIRPGDVIVAFNGRPVTEPDELVVAIRAQSPGDKVVLTVRRAGVDRKVEVTLSAASS